MRKVTLSFNLPDDQPDYIAAIKGPDLYCVIWELALFLSHDVGEHDAIKISKINAKLDDLLERYNIDLKSLEKNDQWRPHVARTKTEDPK
jgi:hypothetical protein